MMMAMMKVISVTVVMDAEACWLVMGDFEVEVDRRREEEKGGWGLSHDRIFSSGKRCGLET